MIQLSETARWYCAITGQTKQRRVEIELASLGFRVFTPKQRRWVTHARVRRAVERPILGRYLFVEIDYPRQSFGDVLATNGVDGMISNVGRPIAFPSHWVEGLLRRYLQGEWDFVRAEPVIFTNKHGELEVRKNDPLRAGSRIRIIEGEFEDMLATVTGVKGNKISFKVLGTPTNGTVMAFSVRAA